MNKHVSKRLTINKKYVDVLLGWNKVKNGLNTQKEDIKFVRLLLLVGVGLVKLAQGEIAPAVKRFIHGKLLNSSR